MIVSVIAFEKTKGRSHKNSKYKCRLGQTRLTMQEFDNAKTALVY